MGYRRLSHFVNYGNTQVSILWLRHLEQGIIRKIFSKIYLTANQGPEIEITAWIDKLQHFRNMTRDFPYNSQTAYFLTIAIIAHSDKSNDY